MGTVSLDFSENFSRRTQQLLNQIAHDPNILTHINEIIGTHLNQYVPMKSGALRGSMYADEEGVHWGSGLPYAGYQYNGEVFAPNIPKIHNGVIVGWVTPRGTTKYNTGRELGLPGYLNGWTFGYTTPGTSHHWDELYTASQWKTGSGGIKSQINNEITQYLKQIASIYYAFSR